MMNRCPSLVPRLDPYAHLVSRATPLNRGVVCETNAPSYIAGIDQQQVSYRGRTSRGMSTLAMKLSVTVLVFLLDQAAYCSKFKDMHYSGKLS